RGRMADAEIDRSAGMLGKRNDQRCQHGNQHHGDHHQRPDDRGRIAREAIPRHVAWRQRFQLVGGFSRHQRASFSRRRGSSMSRMTSTMMLATMKNSPDNST